MKVLFNGNLTPPPHASRKAQEPAASPRHPIHFAEGSDQLSLSRNVKFGNGAIPDTDVKDFWDLVQRNKPPDHLIDQIINGRVKVTPDGSVSYPVHRIDRPKLIHGGNPPFDPGAPGNGGDDGDGSGGPGKPGQGKGKPGPGTGGVGSGGGNQPGDQVGSGDGDGGEGEQAGEGEGSYDRELWTPPIPPSEVAKMIGKEFGLPFLEDKGKGKVHEWIEVHNTKKNPPPGSMFIQDTLTRITGRAAALAEEEGREFDLEADIDNNNLLVDEAQDIVHIGDTRKKKPYTRAVIFYIMDVSGSVSDDMKQKARTNNFLLSNWLKYQYGLMAAKSQGAKYDDEKHYGKGVEERFVVHTDGAKEVSEEEFYTTRQSGGTSISSAYKKVQEIINEHYPPEEWNVYVFQYSDGDSFGDNEDSGAIMDDMLKRGVNLIGYCDLAPRGGWWGFNNFKTFVEDRFGQNQRVRICELAENTIDTYKKAIQKLLADEKKGAA